MLGRSVGDELLHEGGDSLGIGDLVGRRAAGLDQRPPLGFGYRRVQVDDEVADREGGGEPRLGPWRCWSTTTLRASRAVALLRRVASASNRLRFNDAGGEAAARAGLGRDELQDGREGRGASDAGVHVPDHLHLPRRLQTGRGVDPERGLDEGRVLDRGDLALPDLQVGKEGPGAGRECRLVGVVGLRRVGERGGARQLGQTGVPSARVSAVVLGEQPVDVHPSGADGDLAAAADVDAKAVRRRDRTPVGPMASSASAWVRRRAAAMPSLPSASVQTRPCWDKIAAKSRSGPKVSLAVVATHRTRPLLMVLLMGRLWSCS